SGLVSFSWTATSLVAWAPALLVCAGVAVSEELMFRGFAFQRLIDGLGVRPAQLLIGAYFVLTHSGTPGTAGAIGYLAAVNIFVASIAFGAAYLRTRSLAMPIGIHFAANLVQGSVLGFGVSGSSQPTVLMPALAPGFEWFTGGAFGLEASVPGLVCIVLLAALLVLRKPAVMTP
ncbi:MAG: CPBP family intramembrane metalloprotease, partial [Burkholderiales bacterium PBB4]